MDLDDDEANVFKPMLEEIRQQICESDIKSEVDLEQTVSLILTIGVQELGVDDINSTLNVILKFIKENTEKFPSMVLLEYVKQCLENLSKSQRKKKDGVHFVNLSWPTDLRLVIRRLFQTFKISEDYIKCCYELCCSASKALGIIWLQADPQFAVLMTCLTSGRLRIVLESHTEIKMDQLIICLSLLEDLIQCVEDDESDLIGEKDATAISKFEQEAASYVCEFAVMTAEEVNVSHHMECFLVLYSCWWWKDPQPKILCPALPTLLTVCQFCISQRDVETASMLLINLSDFEQLCGNVLDTLLDYVRLIMPTPKAKEGIIQLTVVLEALKDRKGWFTPKAVEETEELCNSIKDPRITDSLADFRYIEYTVEHVKVFKSTIGEDLPSKIRTQHRLLRVWSDWTRSWKTISSVRNFWKWE
uniref:Neurochondrin-like protein n=1 Tax=Ditylenchus dipsaci TaxID=166011 RepID=A0A915EKS7_9BILA